MSLNIEEQNKLIADECDKLKAMLIDKNIKYGGTALAPLRISSSLTPLDKINVRIEDKIGRLIQGDKSREDEDPYWDLAGYVILRSIAKRLFGFGGLPTEGPFPPKVMGPEPDLTPFDVDLLAGRSLEPDLNAKGGKPQPVRDAAPLDITAMGTGDIMEELQRPIPRQGNGG